MKQVQEAVNRFLSYVRMGWEVEESFEIAYDSVFDIVGKEEFLNQCQAACKNQ